MKVTLLTYGYDYIELTVKKRKKIITVSKLAEDEVNLRSDYLASDAINYAPSSSYAESGITVVWARNRNKIVDFQREIIDDEEEDIIASYGNSVTTYREWDTKMLALDLVTYCITKEEKV